MFSQSVPLHFVHGVPVDAFSRVRSMAQGLAFWLAVALPLAYLPLVVVAPGAIADPAMLGLAVTGNLVAIVVGHGHEPSLGRRGRDVTS